MKRFVPFFISFIVLLVGAHYVVYLLFSNAWPELAIQNIWVRSLIFIGASASFILATILVYRSKHPLIQFLYTLAAYWIGVFFYLFFAAFVWGVLMFFFGNVELLAKLSIVGALLISLYGAINARIIRKKMYEINISNLPELWKTKKIVVLSDLHFGAVNGLGFAKRVVREIQKQNPDIVFIVGDFFDGVKVDERALAEVFAELKPKNGVFFVMGNHDEFTDNTEKERLLKHAGMIVLDNQKVNVEGIDILGVDYKSTVKATDLKQALEKLVVDPSVPSILLRHVPTHIDTASTSNIDLVLSGHTHNGQMFPSNYLASRIHKGFGYGLKSLNNTQVLISSGIGTWGPPLRVGTKSELLVLKFK